MNAGGFPVPDLRRYLTGRWTVSRAIEDRARTTTGAFEGAAMFAPDGDDLRYFETGRLLVEAYEGEAFRAYRYVFPAPARALVMFEDGSAFHDLDLSNGTWDATHACAPDVYEGRYTAASADAWQVVWRVRGPRKDLMLETAYKRLDSSFPRKRESSAGPLLPRG
ncbi:MAG: hypothetical protein EXQ86_05975 [Rhodospirillales bacterium]|nr:hypothetical protein [Rhodospirillales bacterium]